MATLQGLLRGMTAERDAAVAALHQVKQRIDRLEHSLRRLQRARFGRRSEKLDPDQLQLALEDIEQARAQRGRGGRSNSPLRAERGRRRRETRPSLPAHLPRVEVVVARETTSCPCCRGAMYVIRENKSERLYVIRAQYRVIVTRRPKYACRTYSGTVVQAPARLIEGGLTTPASETRHYGPGSDEGAANWACVASLVETCKLTASSRRLGSLTHLTMLVALRPAARINELMPWGQPHAVA